MPRTRIKICGITSAGDAVEATNLGADAIGLNFLAGPRRIDAVAATQIYWGLRDDDTETTHRVDIVALCAADKTRFPDAITWDRLSEVFPYPADFLQLYTDSYASIKWHWNPWWMVAPVGSRESLVEIAVQIGMMQTLPAAIVLDTAVKGHLGGTGQSFNWNWIAESRAAGELAGWPPIILAGGLTPDNVADAIRIARPYAVDVSSGVEFPGRPGVKDPARMRDFIQAVRSTDA